MSGSNDNLPPGCTQDALDRALGWDDDFAPELTEEELDAEYRERIEVAADDAPPLVFHECAPAPIAHPMSYRGWESEFRDFLKQLANDDVFAALHLATREVIARKSPAIDYERLGYDLAVGRRA